MSEVTNTAGKTGLVIQLPADKLGENASAQEQALERLRQLLDARAGLFIKAAGADQLDVSIEDGKIGFAWWNQLPPFDDIPLLSELCAALVGYAAKVQRVTTKPAKPVVNEKYAMRSLLYRLGLSGKDHKQVRQLLLGRLDGNSAWKTPPDTSGEHL